MGLLMLCNLASSVAEARLVADTVCAFRTRKQPFNTERDAATVYLPCDQFSMKLESWECDVAARLVTRVPTHAQQAEPSRRLGQRVSEQTDAYRECRHGSGRACLAVARLTELARRGGAVVPRRSPRPAA